jgi:hypothetical protein
VRSASTLAASSSDPSPNAPTWAPTAADDSAVDDSAVVESAVDDTGEDDADPAGASAEGRGATIRQRAVYSEVEHGRRTICVGAQGPAAKVNYSQRYSREVPCEKACASR